MNFEELSETLQNLSEAIGSAWAITTKEAGQALYQLSKALTGVESRSKEKESVRPDTSDKSEVPKQNKVLDFSDQIWVIPKKDKSIIIGPEDVLVCDELTYMPPTYSELDVFDLDSFLKDIGEKSFDFNK